MNLFVGIAGREFSFWKQTKNLLRAYFGVVCGRRKDGWIFVLRLPLGGLALRKNFPDYRCMTGGGWPKTTNAELYFWPNLPLREGDSIYRYNKIVWQR